MTDAELAILSLLLGEAKSDEELHAGIEARGLRRWTAIGVSSMYYVLEKLERQGLVETMKDKLPIRSWQLTSAGYGVLQTAVSDLLSTPHAHARGFELGLANLHVLKPSQTRAALQNYRQDLLTRLARANRELEKEQSGSSAFQATALYSHNVSLMEAELAWLDQFVRDWEAQVIEEPEPPLEPARPIPRMQQVILPQDEDSVHKRTTMQADYRKVTPRPRHPDTH